MERVCHKCKSTPGTKDLYCRNCGAKLPPHIIPNRIIMLVIEVILLLAVILGGVSLMNYITSPKTVITEYYKGLVEGNYELAYARVKPSKEAFLTATDFANAVKSYPFQGLSVEEVMIDKGKDTLKGKVILLNESNKTQYKEEVILVRDGSIGGFWSRWRVKPNFVLKDYQISTPLETSLYINDILVNDKNASVELTKDGMTYTLPEIFAGKYRVKLDSKLYTEVVRILDTNINTSFSMESLQLKEEKKELLNDQCTRDYEYLWQSVYEKVPYEETRFSQENEVLKEEYQNMIDNRIPHGYRNVECVALADYVYDQTFIPQEGTIKAQVTIDALRAFSGRYYYFSIFPTDKIKKDTCKVSFVYGYNSGNGKWELESFFQQ